MNPRKCPKCGSYSLDWNSITKCWNCAWVICGYWEKPNENECWEKGNGNLEVDIDIIEDTKFIMIDDIPYIAYKITREWFEQLKEGAQK